MIDLFVFFDFLCAVFSDVQRETPVCCYNYFNYTCYGVLQQSGNRVQFNLQ